MQRYVPASEWNTSGQGRPWDLPVALPAGNSWEGKPSGGRGCETSYPRLYLTGVMPSARATGTHIAGRDLPQASRARLLLDGDKVTQD